MKAVQTAKPNELELISIEKSVIAEKDNVLVKMTVVGICDSDVGIYHGTNTATAYPRIVNHEMMGRVEGAGPGVASLKVGDRVIISQVTSCEHRYPCKIGRGGVCDSLVVWGMYTDGGYREYITIPESNCHILPKSLPGQGAVMVEPTTIGIQSYTRADLEEDDLLLIYGSSALSNSTLKIAHLLCDHVIVADVAGDELEAARASGATRTINVLKENLIEKVKEYTYGHGATVSIDTVCNEDSLISLLQATGNAGRVMTTNPSATPTEIDQFLVTSRELDVKDSRLQSKIFGKATELINEGKLGLTNSISHTFPLTKAQEASDFVDNHDPSIRRIALTFDF